MFYFKSSLSIQKWSPCAVRYISYYSVSGLFNWSLLILLLFIYLLGHIVCPPHGWNFGCICISLLAKGSGTVACRYWGNFWSSGSWVAFLLLPLLLAFVVWGGSHSPILPPEPCSRIVGSVFFLVEYPSYCLLINMLLCFSALLLFQYILNSMLIWNGISVVL